MGYGVRTLLGLVSPYLSARSTFRLTCLECILVVIFPKPVSTEHTMGSFLSCVWSYSSFGFLMGIRRRFCLHCWILMQIAIPLDQDVYIHATLYISVDRAKK